MLGAQNFEIVGSFLRFEALGSAQLVHMDVMDENAGASYLLMMLFAGAEALQQVFARRVLSSMATCRAQVSHRRVA